ncbi:predicted protein [Sclerotinia sclerotiorum 1980 UF-70]|uniref:Uncharacterized protein n=1 Tax=Sclerotinia sclerotiorum (strain ATCC 18683 / 1980 / Ss-1) TaxID=665079 RepID=A7E4Q1_SCLS1|nr:predicted protein [Sclerotinia sclerotiorum 1980 UF-70]EDN90873.1 predicted protein [Sclerotinia sclerotiorum 1980 UF-70]
MNGRQAKKQVEKGEVYYLRSAEWWEDNGESRWSEYGNHKGEVKAVRMGCNLSSRKRDQSSKAMCRKKCSTRFYARHHYYDMCLWHPLIFAALGH